MVDADGYARRAVECFGKGVVIALDITAVGESYLVAGADGQAASNCGNSTSWAVGERAVVDDGVGGE